ncbi:MAG: addiction module toxin RelE [Cyanobacteria bacterium DS3.002]|nr:addiction module toxin RelE [Cyanobacteria bacterium DS3.002]MBA4049636.1 addiction module toxin RelE [Cyanobacteria bacterium DS2.008]MBA4073399.1 addiction module toxin RelE [Cyanobacteria bacterium PR.023]
MRKPDLTNDAMRFLKKRDNKQFLQILEAITSLCDDPRPHDSIAMGNGHHFRKDIGEFRVIYRFDDKNMMITVIGNRNDSAAYQEFDRKK